MHESRLQIYGLYLRRKMRMRCAERWESELRSLPGLQETEETWDGGQQIRAATQHFDFTKSNDNVFHSKDHAVPLEVIMTAKDTFWVLPAKRELYLQTFAESITYSQVCGLVRARLAFALARSTSHCLRGNREPQQHRPTPDALVSGAGIRLLKTCWKTLFGRTLSLTATASTPVFRFDALFPLGLASKAPVFFFDFSIFLFDTE